MMFRQLLFMKTFRPFVSPATTRNHSHTGKLRSIASRVGHVVIIKTTNQYIAYAHKTQTSLLVTTIWKLMYMNLYTHIRTEIHVYTHAYMYIHTNIRDRPT